MAVRKLIYLPDKKLREVSKPVGLITKEIKILAQDLIDTMQAKQGIGLAAIQVGVPLRMFVIDRATAEEDAATTPLAPEDNAEPLVVINPEVLWFSSESHVYNEGCLSIPDYYAQVKRPILIYMRFTTLEGKTEQLELQGLLSTCAQHEIDHLDGILFLDHLTKIKRDRMVSKFTKNAEFSD